MFFDEESIIAAHDEILHRWDDRKTLFEVIVLACDILQQTAWRYRMEDGIASWTAMFLASRQRQNIGAIGALILRGYFSSSYSLLRDLAESGLLFTKFKLRPDSLNEWTKVVSDLNRTGFAGGLIE